MSKASKGKKLTSLKEKVFKLLDENSLLSAKRISQILQINYNKKKGYLWKLKHDWKNILEDKQGLKGLSFHAVRFYGYAVKGLDKSLAIERGWIQSKSKNHRLIWKDHLGRLDWFLNGRVNGWVRKPANKGKMLQLLANGFSYTSLIEDINLFTKWANSFNVKGAHMVLDTGVRLPYVKTSLLKESNGVIVTLGDKSHRTSLEIAFEFPMWAERLESLTKSNIKTIEKFSDFMNVLSSPKSLDRDKAFYIS